MKPKIKELKKAIKDSENISFWFDYLRLKIDNVKCKIFHIHKHIINRLDFDNSNYLHFDDFWYDLTAQKIKLSNWIGLIISYSFYWVSIPIYIYLEYFDIYRTLFNSIWKIDFYWSFFRLKEIWEFNDDFIFWDLLNWFEITRVDWRIDFFNYKKRAISQEIISSRKNTRLQTYMTDWYINSWRYWNKDNKTIVVRWYDKKLDISKKWKFRLYWDYQKFDNVFRLEWEFLNKFCKWYTIDTFSDLENKIKTYIWLDNNYTWKYFYSYNKLDLRDEFSRTKYCKVMSSYIRNALMSWINVYNYVDIELDKLWFSKIDIEKIKNNSINILDTWYFNKN